MGPWATRVAWHFSPSHDIDRAGVDLDQLGATIAQLVDSKAREASLFHDLPSRCSTKIPSLPLVVPAPVDTAPCVVSPPREPSGIPCRRHFALDFPCELSVHVSIPYEHQSAPLLPRFAGRTHNVGSVYRRKVRVCTTCTSRLDTTRARWACEAAGHHVTPEELRSWIKNRCNRSLDLMLQLMLQPMFHPETACRPMVVAVVHGTWPRPVAIRKALSDPPRIFDSWPRWGGRSCTPVTPPVGVAQGECFPPGRAKNLSRKSLELGGRTLSEARTAIVAASANCFVNRTGFSRD